MNSLKPEQRSIRLKRFKEGLKERVVGLSSKVFSRSAFSTVASWTVRCARRLGAVAAVIRFGAVAAIIAAVQAYLLYSQNRLQDTQNQLIRAQNKLVEAQNRLSEVQNQQARAQAEASQLQAEASQLQAVSFLISSIDPNNPSRTDVATAQLAEYGTHGVAALFRLAAADSKVAPSALRVLFGQSQLHTPQQVLQTFSAWNARLEKQLPITSKSLKSEPQIVERMWRELTPNRVLRDFNASAEYFEGLMKRFEKGGTFETELRTALKQDPDAFIKVLEAGYEVLFKEARKQGIVVKEDKVSANTALGWELWQWHVDVYSLCRAMASQPIPLAFEIFFSYSDEITRPWLSMEAAVRSDQPPGPYGLIFNEWLEMPEGDRNK